MRAGRLDRRIKLLRRDTAQDSYGEDIITWTEIDEVWAGWEPLKGAARWTAQQTVETADGAFRIRYRSDLTSLHAVEYSGDRYDINGHPEEIGRKKWLLLHVSRRTTDAV